LTLIQYNGATSKRRSPWLCPGPSGGPGLFYWPHSGGLLVTEGHGAFHFGDRDRVHVASLAHNLFTLPGCLCLLQPPGPLKFTAFTIG
jgi:hypothetical protein